MSRKGSMKAKKKLNKTVLHVDIDWKIPKSWLKLYEETRRILLEALGFKLERVIIKPSSSGRGYHVWLHILGRKLSDHEINKFQWIVGNDDPTRCRINYLRIRRGMRAMWNKLFSHVIWRKPLPKRCQKCRLRKVINELMEKDKVEMGSGSA